MKRMTFDSDGRLESIDFRKMDKGRRERHNVIELPAVSPVHGKRFEPDTNYWSLWEDGKKLEPLKFSNGKTQEDVVREVVDYIRNGKKLVFIRGTCGTGKSAIALNIARQLGRASVVVPIKNLQRQYEEDYVRRKYLIKGDGNSMKIAMITGRDNHDSVFMPGVSCADQFLPDTIKFTDKNSEQIRDYYQKNPFIKSKVEFPSVRQLRRISIAPANPYWSPIAPATIELRQLSDAQKKRYLGLNDKEFIFYHRKEGCTYYDQYDAYIDADVIIFNSAKYKIESVLNRKPATDVEIIDEADEFLDSFSAQEELNISRLIRALGHIGLESESARKTRDKIIELLELEERQKKAIGVDEDRIYELKETHMERLFPLLLQNQELVVEISLDEMNYANKALEVAQEFLELKDDTYTTFSKRDDMLYAGFATTSISKQFKEIIDKNKAFVFMSGTIHSEEVLKHIFGIDDFVIVDAEHLHQGSIEIHRTGKEFDCRYSSFKSGAKTRKDYLGSLKACVDKAKRPVLIHVNAFEDLPTELEAKDYQIPNIPHREKMKERQNSDRTGKMIMEFKKKRIQELFTTRCSRGIDFPGDICNSVIFTKYPNPNVNETFWKVLQQTHKDYYWEFYRDKARREFLQRLYRAVRSPTDHVFVLSPDIRVLDAVRDIQLMQMNSKVKK